MTRSGSGSNRSFTRTRRNFAIGLREFTSGNAFPFTIREMLRGSIPRNAARSVWRFPESKSNSSIRSPSSCLIVFSILRVTHSVLLSEAKYDMM